jgi:hypothetical protein
MNLNLPLSILSKLKDFGIGVAKDVAQSAKESPAGIMASGISQSIKQKSITPFAQVPSNIYNKSIKGQSLSPESAVNTAMNFMPMGLVGATEKVGAKILGGVEKNLAQEARKYQTAEDFVKAVQNESNISQQGKLEAIPLNKISGTDYPELDSALKKGKLSLDEAQNLLPDNGIDMSNSKVSMPIEVIKNSDGTYSLMAGNHRVAQQLVNGEKTIFANIQNEKGFSTKSQLTDIWNKAHKK